MSTPTGDSADTADPTTSVQPLRDEDTSIEPDPTRDPAQAEWDRTIALDEGADPEELDAATATGADPAEVRTDEDQIPASDLPREAIQPESQGDSPIEAALGEDGQGDLAPEDL
ncbi:sugar ABC transporter ATPase [Microbacterium sp. zg.B48]|uniref:sugar ABC transporter ATPase n=1 Tax=Microbacterium sp. zg.B48 TaxID=2969408 RepID=UPI00214C9784|nr:sugar ABC transporter ATPase [Microbacterium sp. zg.B48]MCR2764605.1 sugar ABC transporter ATPase [Microbacterium sp. zg.B48]